jgi:hypothetical protein
MRIMKLQAQTERPQDSHGWIGTEVIKTRFGDFEFKNGYPTAAATDKLYELAHVQPCSRIVSASLDQTVPRTLIALAPRDEQPRHVSPASAHVPLIRQFAANETEFHSPPRFPWRHTQRVRGPETGAVTCRYTCGPSAAGSSGGRLQP